MTDQVCAILRASPAAVKGMKRLGDQMTTAVLEGQAVDYLESDEAFLAAPYEASPRTPMGASAPRPAVREPC